ncbi:hypothetical protein C8Q79DRAFT_905086, partial [Trametes meyenii]
MHNLFLGEVLHHCRRVWDIDVAQDKQPAAPKLVQRAPEEQQKYLDKIFAATCSRAEKKLAATRKDYLSAVARFNNIVGNTSSELTRQELASALLDWVRASLLTAFHTFNTIIQASKNDPKTLRLPPVLNNPATRFRLPADEPPPKTSRYDLFSNNVLEQVRADIKATTLPSWMEAPPSNFGSSAHGKLKADIWRTVGTVNLVITIYLRGLRSLFDHKLVPNHHLSLHLRPLLELFGPVHGWWAFPFERYNGILQCMNTNSRASDMPATFMKSWYMGANIRWLMRTTEWPDEPVYGDMIETFEAAFRDRVRGTRVTDLLNSVKN